MAGDVVDATAMDLSIRPCLLLGRSFVQWFATSINLLSAGNHSEEETRASSPGGL